MSNDTKTELNDLKIDIIDTVNRVKVQTILWVAGIGILKLLIYYVIK